MNIIRQIDGKIAGIADKIAARLPGSALHWHIYIYLLIAILLIIGIAGIIWIIFTMIFVILYVYDRVYNPIWAHSTGLRILRNRVIGKGFTSATFVDALVATIISPIMVIDYFDSYSKRMPDPLEDPIED